MNEYSNAKTASGDARWLDELRQRRDEAVKRNVTWTIEAKEFAQAYDLGERDFENVDMRNQDLHGMQMSGTRLDGAILTSAQMTGTQMDGAQMTGAMLDGAWLTGAQMIDVNLIGAKLNFAILNGARLTGAQMDGAQMTGAQVIGAMLDGARLTGAWMDSAILVRAVLTRANLTGARLSGAWLTNAILSRTNLEHADLTGAILDGTCLDPRALVPKTDLSAFKRTDEGTLIGYRTKESLYILNRYHKSDQRYVVPIFSVDITGEFHPGLSVLPDLESARALAEQYNTSIVVVHIDPAHALQTVGGNYRCRAFTVDKEIPVN
jgi:uncharacterized protein YjbI with pentapeptide repeats